MNTFFKTTTFLTGVSVALLIASGSTNARDAIIGLSPAQSPADLQAQAERVIEHLIETVDPGETALIFDALEVELIGTFEVPNNDAYANPRAKLQANRAVLTELRAFFEGAVLDDEHPGAVNLPDFLRTIRAHYPSDDPRSIIVLGSPLYDDPLAPSMSMLRGGVPNDGAIAAPSHVTPYSTGNLSGTLEGDQLLFGIVPSAENWAVSQDHGYHVERLWTLTMEAHGGETAYFGEDLQTLFRLASDGVEGSAHAQPLAPTDKLELVRFLPDQGRVGGRPAPEPELAQDVDWHNAVSLNVRATWDCTSCDLDLYVQPNETADTLYYAQSRTADGQLYKELREGVTNGFEVVVLNGLVDVADLVVAINFYDHQAVDGLPDLPITGQIELSIGDVARTIPFALDAETGNRGENWQAMLADTAEVDPRWVVWRGADLIATQ